MKLVDNAKDWYKFTSVQAALCLAVLETVQAFGYDLPEFFSISIALMIPILRIIKQEAR